MTTPNNHGQHRTSDHAGLGAALGGMRDRSSSAASDDEQNRPTLRGRAGIFDVMISQHTRLGLRAQPFSHSRIARRLLPCTGLSNRRADRLLPDRPADLPHAAHEGHIGALSFRRSVQFSAALLIGRNPDHLFVGTQAENMRDAGALGGSKQ